MKKILIKGMSPNLAGTETFIMTYYRNLDSSEFKIDFLVNTKEKIIQLLIIFYNVFPFSR